MSKYTDAFTQVYVILNELDDDDYEKIPPEIIAVMRKNRNKEYQFEIDESVDLKDNNLLPEARALLFKIYRDYLVTPEQKQKIIKMQNEERTKKELRKQKQYSIDVFANKKSEIESELETTANQQPISLVSYKEGIFKKVLQRIKKIFIRNK